MSVRKNTGPEKAARTIGATSNNSSLHSAKAAKNDEFYTQLSDIADELKHYKAHFKGKVVYCNCDDPRVSNFFHYFSHNFEALGLKKLIATCYKSQDAGRFSRNDSNRAVSLEYAGDKNGNCVPDVNEIGITYLDGDGDFRSEESIALLKQADIVVSNPPFSLFKEYVAQLVEHEKKFLIVGNNNAITYKETFKLIKDNKLWMGVSPRSMTFKLPDGSTKDVNACWFTNLSHKKRNEELILYKTYKGNESEYPKYANYDAIEVSKVKDIPLDYAGVMGVPITFLDKYNPNQFEIVGLGIATSGLEVGVQPYTPEHRAYRKNVQKRGVVNGDLYLMRGEEVVVPYARILIKHKTQ